MAFEKGKEIRPEKNPVLRLFRHFIPVTRITRASVFHKARQPDFCLAAFCGVAGCGKRRFGFAVDSVPAVLAITPIRSSSTRPTCLPSLVCARCSLPWKASCTGFIICTTTFGGAGVRRNENDSGGRLCNSNLGIALCHRGNTHGLHCSFAFEKTLGCKS